MFIRFRTYGTQIFFCFLCYQHLIPNGIGFDGARLEAKCWRGKRHTGWLRCVPTARGCLLISISTNI